MEEVKTSASKLNMGKHAGKDDIFVEILQYGENYLTDIIYRIILNIWNAKCVLKKWINAIMSTLYWGIKVIIVVCFTFVSG